ncbi:glycosyltransferase [Pyramidobacter sp.]|uniref:glycosyltransferase n=1 Tax=Pyramidobacter sp. TaxID=1943581 RepID=UPI00331CE688
MNCEPHIEILEELPPHLKVQLHNNAALWGNVWDDGNIDRMFSRSFCCAALLIGDELLGIGGVLSDGVSDAYIPKVIVRSDYRGMNWEGKITARLKEELQRAGIRKICCAGTDVKISVIVPVYNDAPHLRRTLDSLIMQTLMDIEIICIDDHSTDESAKILSEYSGRDSRVILIRHSLNSSASQARKDGVLVSQGKYVMFCDGDDELVPEACEKAYDAIEQYQTDVVQFGTCVKNCANMSANRIASNQKSVAPYLGKISGVNLIDACWTEKKFGFQLWNKIYDGDLCRHAFQQIEDGKYPKAQDLYAFFVFAYYAHSYAGIKDSLYTYNFGLGVTGGDSISFSKYDVLLSERRVYDALVRFLERENAKDQYESVLSSIYDHFLHECVSKWLDQLAQEDKSEGFRHLVEVWGFGKVLCHLAQHNWYKRADLALKLIGVDFFHHKKQRNKSVPTVAVYYRSISNGGAQRVSAQLANIWASMKNDQGEPLYNVLLITDDGPAENEYGLAPNVKRDYLPDYQTAIKDLYAERFEAWQRILTEHDVDIVVSGMWVAPCALWDMLAVKGHPSKPAFVHTFCCVPYLWSGSTELELLYRYQLCDGVVTLSECDQAFVSAFNSHAKYILNPVTFDPDQTPVSTYRPNTLLWLGRISYEKRPLDAVKMMAEVVREIPDAKLYIVGDGSPELMNALVSLTEQLGLNDNIEICGFTLDVAKYYVQASVFVCTSTYEGFSLTLSEAMSYGLPIVTYDMPWLTYLRDGRGSITVSQGRYDLLAKQAVRLLQDPELGRKLGNDARQLVGDIASADIAFDWKMFFGQLSKEEATCSRVSKDIPILLKYLTLYQNETKKNLNRKIEEAKKVSMTNPLPKELLREKEALQRSKRQLEQSLSFRIGRAVTFIPRFLRDRLRLRMSSVSSRK